MSDLSQFTNKTLSTSPIGDMLSNELTKSGLDHAMESMTRFAGFLQKSGAGGLKNQITQMIDDFENSFIQLRSNATPT